MDSQDCPMQQECYPISYYTNNNFTIPSNFTLIFLKGDHILTDSLLMKGLHNVTLKGQGQWVQGFHWSVMQSNVFIRCASNVTIGINISYTNTVHIDGLTISDCPFGLSLTSVFHKSFYRTSVQNCSRLGIDICGQELDKADVFIMKESSISNISQPIRVFSHSAMSSYKLTSVNSSFNFGIKFKSNHGFVFIERSLFFHSNSAFRFFSIKNESVINSSVVIQKSNFIGTTFIAIEVFCYNVTIEDCTITKSNVPNPSVLIVIVGKDINLLRIHRLNISNNVMQYGILIQLSETVSNTDIFLEHIQISNNTFRSERVYGAGLFIGCQKSAYKILFSDINITNNNMGGMYIRNCRVNFGGQPSLIANNSTPYSGGGINADGTTAIASYVPVQFVNNTAREFGGAIYISARNIDHITLSFANEISWCSIENLTATFEGNSASIAGDNIYGGEYFDCDWYEGNENISDCTKWHQTPPMPIAHLMTRPLGVCICSVNGLTDCKNMTVSEEIYPGQSIHLSLATVGMCGEISPGVIAIESKGIDVLLGNSAQVTENACSNFTFQLNQNGSNNGEIVLSIKRFDDAIWIKGTSLHIDVKFLQCPLGLELALGVCVCNNIIAYVSQCDVSWVLPIKRTGNVWLYYSHQYNCFVAYQNCPFDYCLKSSDVSLSLNESDGQCSHNRSGILCGGCQPGLSLMLGSNQCDVCENKYIILLSAFISAGIGLVAFLLICNLTVSVGSINGLLFYANLIKFNEAFISADGVNIPVLNQFISWLNLDLGIQTCFFNGLDGYWKTWLQFSFPLYIWILIGFIVVGCHYSGRLSRLCGNNAVPVLATLILMSYSKLLRTITNGLMMATIKCEDKVWNVWSVDGNITYLNGKHIPLFVVSVLFLLTSLVYTGLVFSSQWLQFYSGKCCTSFRNLIVKLKPLIDAYTGPYKNKYRFWTGVLLIMRLILIPVFSYTTGTLPQLNNYIIAIVSFTLLAFVRGKYRNKWNTALEFFFLFNLGFTSILPKSVFKFNHFLNIASVTLSLLVFLGIVAFHVLISIKRKYGLKFELCVKSRETNEDAKLLLQESSNEEELYSPANVVIRRESLIFDFDKSQ